MIRALGVACIAAVIGVAGPAQAAKPKIAILGLEAAPGSGGAVDPATTQMAREITQELRLRTQGGASPYVIAPNSAKELTEEKLLMSCDNEAPSCMAVIGAGLAADFLLYGRVEKKGGVYRVSLRLLDVKGRKIQSAGTDELVLGGAASGVAKRLHKKLIGEVQRVGILTIKATSQTGARIRAGTVKIDAEPKGALTDGSVTVTGIAEGRHTLTIEADGHRRFEERVTIHAGEQVTLSALMLEKDDGGSGSGGSALWKVTFGASLVVAAGGGGLAAYGYYKQGELTYSGTGKGPTSDDCGKSPAELGTLKTERGVSFKDDDFYETCTWHKRHVLGIVVASVGGVGAIASLIMMLRDPGSSEKLATVPLGKKRELAVSPILTPGTAGASLSLRW